MDTETQPYNLSVPPPPAPIGPSTAPNPRPTFKPPIMAGAPTPPPPNLRGPTINMNGQDIPLSQFYQQYGPGMANVNPATWQMLNQMYGTGYQNSANTGNTAPSMYMEQPPSRYSAPMPPMLRGGPSNTAPSMYMEQPPVQGRPPYTPAPVGPSTAPNMRQPIMGQNPNVNNLAMLGGRHLPVRRTLWDINTNSQELPLMMGILSAAGIDPQAAMGEFRSYLPRGSRVPATVF